MKKIILLILVCFLSAVTQSVAQTSRLLGSEELKTLERNIPPLPFPVFRAYEYKDNGGDYFIFLCEKQYRITAKDTFREKITAFCYRQEQGIYSEKWKISDFLEPAAGEVDMRFWTKYFSASDMDGDGIIEPVIVYGSWIEGEEARRIKIITIYKGEKYVIRAVECILDHCRTFKIDKNFKMLPVKVQVYLNKLLEKIRKEQDVLLTDG